jgi:L-alanine-DL-glutamate epimerase-like enolase superfamily enzyme
MLESLEVFHLVTPLTRPYVLSFGPLTQFDSYIGLARMSDGSWRCGESMPLPGYSHETAELIASEYAHLTADRDLPGFLERNAGNPFVTSPVDTCLDDGFPRPVGATVALCPILQWNDHCEIAERAAELAAAGNTVAKMKLSGAFEANRSTIRETIRAAESTGLKFRYDANQAMTPDLAAATVRLLDHPSTELLEQPFRVDAWGDQEWLARGCPIPLMLDESIVDAAALERAAGCASIIKLKLTKNRTPSGLRALIQRARELGLDVILGNGAQGSVGCLVEGWVQAETGLTRPGEMNGYRKVVDDPLGFLIADTPTGMRLPEAVDWERVRAALVNSARTRFEVRV